MDSILWCTGYQLKIDDVVKAGESSVPFDVGDLHRSVFIQSGRRSR